MKILTILFVSILFFSTSSFAAKKYLLDGEWVLNKQTNCEDPISKLTIKKNKIKTDKLKGKVYIKKNSLKLGKDLKGKKVATSPFTSSNAFLPLVLKQNGLKESDIQLVKSDPGALSPMMITGNTDAIIAWVTNTALFKAQAESAGKEIIEMPVQIEISPK